MMQFPWHHLEADQTNSIVAGCRPRARKEAIMKRTRFLPVIAVIMTLLMAVSPMAVSASVAPPPEPIVPVSESAQNPLGNLPQQEISEIGQVEPFFMAIYNFRRGNTRRGHVSRGVQAETLARVNRPTTLGFAHSLGISNTWSSSLGTSDFITTEIGFSVTHSTTATASYLIHLNPNDMGSITAYDMFNVTYFTVTRTPLIGSTQHSNGWAAQWTNFGFSSRTW